MPVLHTTDIVSFASQNSNDEVQTHTITAPTNLGNGDLWVIQILWRQSDQTINVPTGWTLAQEVKNTTVSNRGAVAVLWKIADGTETSVDIGFSFTTRTAWGSMRITDFDSSNPINNTSVFSSEGTDTDTVALPSINSVNGNLLLVAGGRTNFAGLRSISNADGMTLEYHAQDNGSAGVGSYGLSEDVAADGAVGNKNIVWDAVDEQVAVLYDINSVSTALTISGIKKADGLTNVPDGTAVQHLYADDNKGTNETSLEIKTTTGGEVTFDQQLPTGKVRFIRTIYRENSRDHAIERFFSD